MKDVDFKHEIQLMDRTLNNMKRLLDDGEYMTKVKKAIVLDEIETMLVRLYAILNLVETKIITQNVEMEKMKDRSKNKIFIKFKNKILINKHD